MLFDLFVQALAVDSSFASTLFAPKDAFLAGTYSSKSIAYEEIPDVFTIDPKMHSKTQLVQAS